MTMPDDDMYIVHRIKTPWKVLFIDADIAGCLGMVALGGFAAKYYISTMVVVSFIGYHWHKTRESNPAGYMKHFVHWNMPNNIWAGAFKATPPSSYREMIG